MKKKLQFVLKSLPIGKRFRVGLLFSFFIFSFSVSKAQWVTIPDTGFVAFLQNQYPSSMNGNLLNTSSAEILNETQIWCSYSNIHNLSGIQYFTSLEYLDCHHNYLTQIPILPSSVYYLDCSYNQITQINSLSSSSLVTLNCSDNQIGWIPPIFSLQYLYCDYNQISSFQSLPSGLIYLWCGASGLTSLPNLPSTLERLYVQGGYLTSLPALPSSLKKLWVQGNHSLSSLPPLPSALEELNVDSDSISVLPSLPNTLKILYCFDNLISTLPTLPSSLIELSCGQNLISNLPSLPSTLKSLACNENLLTSIPLLPSQLNYFNCSNNSLLSLPILPASLISLGCKNTQIDTLLPLPPLLTGLDCSYNQISYMPTLPSGLVYLYCSNNQLSILPFIPSSTYFELDCSDNQITSLTNLPPVLYKFRVGNNPGLNCIPPLLKFSGFNWNLDFDITNTGVSCFPNVIQHSGYWATIDTMPICDLFNTNNCEIAWNIQGASQLDVDQNCVTTTDVAGVNGIKMKLYDSGGNLLQQVIANWGGDYSFDTQLGVYSTSVDTLGIPFNIICPDSNIVHHNLTAIDSLDYSVNFRLGCKPGFDVGAWDVHAGNHFFPNEVSHVTVSAGDAVLGLYNVSCNSSSLSGQVMVIINGPVTYQSSVAGALTPVISGDTLIYNITDFSTVNTSTAFSFYLLTDSLAPLGSLVCFEVWVTPIGGDNNFSNNHLTHCFVVTNSFDPNEKEVSPLNVFEPNHWLTYTIHFQNTGTASAHHIQILDTLDSDLDASTFELLSYSHTPMVQLNGSNVAFNFININLPDSTSDFEGSQGYVEYRVKSLPNLPVGTSIENTASIYFDFNAPVLTNTVSNSLCVPLAPTNISATICSNHPYNFNGLLYNTTGIYSMAFNSANYCDSIVNLNLTVLPSPVTLLNESICTGDTFHFNGQNISSSGNYSVSLSAMNACDSIANLNLSVFNPFNLLNQNICVGNNYLFHGINLSAAGIYYDTLVTTSGCTSVTELHLAVFNSASNILNESICSNESYNFNGSNLNTEGTYTETLNTIYGCDSLVTLNLSVMPAQIISTSVAICAGDSYDFFGQQLTSSGNYSMAYSAANGCDSTFNLQLVVFYPVIHSFAQTICNGDVFDFNGQQLSSSGNYSSNYTAVSGCDSILNLSLLVLPYNESSMNESVCAGDFFDFNGLHLSTSGNYNVTLNAANGCDSIINLLLTVEHVNTTILTWGDSLIALSGGTIQWFNCNKQQTISGATQNVFVPSTSGSYAAIITEGNCVDTTSCIQFFTSVNDLSIEQSQFTIYPNPTDESVTVQLSQPCEHCRIEISNTLGQILFSKIINEKEESINLAVLPAGVYFVELLSDKISAMNKLVKQ